MSDSTSTRTSVLRGCGTRGETDTNYKLHDVMRQINAQFPLTTGLNGKEFTGSYQKVDRVTHRQPTTHKNWSSKF